MSYCVTPETERENSSVRPNEIEAQRRDAPSSKGGLRPIGDLPLIQQILQIPVLSPPDREAAERLLRRRIAAIYSQPPRRPGRQR